MKLTLSKNLRKFVINGKYHEYILVNMIVKKQLLIGPICRKILKNRNHNARMLELKKEAITLRCFSNGTILYFSSIIELSSRTLCLALFFPTKTMTFSCIFQDADTANYLRFHYSVSMFAEKLDYKKQKVMKYKDLKI